MAALGILPFFSWAKQEKYNKHQKNICSGCQKVYRSYTRRESAGEQKDKRAKKKPINHPPVPKNNYTPLIVLKGVP